MQLAQLQARAQPAQKCRIGGEPNQAHSNMNAGQQNRFAQYRLTRGDELRQKGEVKEGDFGIQDIGEQPFGEGVRNINLKT